MESEIEVLRRQVATLTEAVKTLHERVREAEGHIVDHGKKANESIGILTTLVGGLVRDKTERLEAKMKAPKRARFTWFGVS
jgi:hypothetical protein